MHLDLQHAVPLALLTAPAFHVEAEPPRVIPTDPRRRQPREQIADLVEHACVRRRIAPRRPPDRRLVHHDAFLQQVQPANLPMRPRPLLAAVPLSEDRATQDVIHQRRLAAPADARHAGQRPERDPHIHVLQVVLGRPDDFEPPLVRPRCHPLPRNRDRKIAREVPTRRRPRIGQDFRYCSLPYHLAPVQPRTGSEVDHMIRRPDRVLVMLDHDHGVPDVPQSPQGLDQPLVVPLVQPDAGLVQDVQDAHQSGADLRREADPLGLATAQGPALPIQRQVAQADLPHERKPLPDLAHHLAGEALLVIGHPEPGQERLGIGNRKPAEVRDAQSRDRRVRPTKAARFRARVERHGQQLRTQPAPLADIARLERHVRLQPVPGELAF